MSAQVTGDILTITIQHSGGCMEHIMEVYVLDAFLESYPPQADCYIYHDDPGDPCDAIVPTTDGFDLLPLADLYISSYGTAGPLILNLYSFDGLRLQVDYNIN